MNQFFFRSRSLTLMNISDSCSSTTFSFIPNNKISTKIFYIRFAFFPSAWCIQCSRFRSIYSLSVCAQKRNSQLSASSCAARHRLCAPEIIIIILFKHLHALTMPYPIHGGMAQIAGISKNSSAAAVGDGFCRWTEKKIDRLLRPTNRNDTGKKKIEWNTSNFSSTSATTAATV